MRFGHGELHLFLLALLAQRPMHGYELMAEMQARLGRRYRASPGSIYPALQAMEAEGLIEARPDGDRRVYAVTDEGHGALTTRASRLAALESRLGVQVSTGVDALCARLTARVTTAAARGADPSAIEPILEDAAARIEELTTRRRT